MATPQRAPHDPNRVPGLIAGANDGSSSPVELQADPITGRLLVNATLASGLSLPTWDYMSLAQASTTDTYSFRLGGVSGTLVATVTVTFTDSGKGTIANVAKS